MPPAPPSELPARTGRRSDLLTVIALAVVAYALANVVHEGLGHAGACVLIGGRPQVLSAIHFEGDYEAFGARGVWAVQAAGTVMNLVVVAASWMLLRATRPGRSSSWRLFLWLVFTVNLLQATGYWLFSGLGNVGDWAAIAETTSRPGLARVVLAVVGGAGYVLAILASLVALRPFAGGDDGRVARGRRIALTAYLTGGSLYVAAGLLNPASPVLVLISAAAASFGGTSAMAWMTSVMNSPRFAGTADAEPVERSRGWILAAAVAAVLFVFVLGPGLRFSR